MIFRELSSVYRDRIGPHPIQNQQVTKYNYLILKCCVFQVRVPSGPAPATITGAISCKSESCAKFFKSNGTESGHAIFPNRSHKNPPKL